jgi:hypothetical protein
MTSIIKHHGADLVLFPVLTLQLIDASSSWVSRSDLILKYNDYWEIPIIKGDFYLPECREKYVIKETDMILLKPKYSPDIAPIWHSKSVEYMIKNKVLLLGEGFPDASPVDDSWGYPFTINYNQSVIAIKPTILIKY